MRVGAAGGAGLPPRARSPWSPDAFPADQGLPLPFSWEVTVYERPEEELLLRRSYVMQTPTREVETRVAEYADERLCRRFFVKTLRGEDAAFEAERAHESALLTAWVARVSFATITAESAVRVFGAVDYALAAVRSLHRADLITHADALRVGRIVSLAAVCAVRQGRLDDESIGALEEYGWSAGEDPTFPELWRWISDAQAEHRRRSFRVIPGEVGW